ncbi:hypothetical protein BH20ACI2_BH20ACI2_08580 [soil metagenome]
MSESSRFGVSVEDELLQSFDALIATQGYANRSEALRDLMRDAIIKSKIQKASDGGEALGSLTLLYDHHSKDLSERMGELQHENYGLIISVLHFHVSHDDCMEVIVLRGDVRDIRSLASALLSLRGVKHGDLFVTVPSGRITSAKRAAAVSHARWRRHRFAVGRRGDYRNGFFVEWDRTLWRPGGGGS